jgi:hypothetical protein
MLQKEHRRSNDLEPTPAAPLVTFEQQLTNSGNGTTLDASTAAQLGPQFEHSLEGIQIHSDARAYQMTDQIGAKAFTSGGHIFFGRDQYQPHTESGLQLLTHELTHVFQQHNGEVAPRSLEPSELRSERHAPLEREARSKAEQRSVPSPKTEAAAPVAPPIPIQAPSANLVQCELSDEMSQNSDTAETDQRQQMQTAPPPAMQVHNIDDVRQARTLLSEIQGYDANMERGARDNNITAAQFNANTNIKEALNDYLFVGGEQSRTLSDFQRNVSRVITRG